MRIKDMVTNVKNMCKKENIEFEDFLCATIMEQLDLFYSKNSNEEDVMSEIIDFKEATNNDYYVLWDMQPALEEDEETAQAIQHIRDILDVFLGR